MRLIDKVENLISFRDYIISCVSFTPLSVGDTNFELEHLALGYKLTYHQS